MVKALYKDYDNPFCDLSGNPLTGGKVYTYASGTSTPHATYTDSAGLTANANPIILDSQGRAHIWMDQAVAYRIVVTDASANVIVPATDYIYGALTPTGYAYNNIALSQFATGLQQSVIGYPGNINIAELALGAPLAISSGNILGATGTENRFLLKEIKGLGTATSLDNTILNSNYKTYEIWIESSASANITMSISNNNNVSFITGSGTGTWMGRTNQAGTSQDHALYSANYDFGNYISSGYPAASISGSLSSFAPSPTGFVQMRVFNPTNASLQTAVVIFQSELGQATYEQLYVRNVAETNTLQVNAPGSGSYNLWVWGVVDD